MPIVLLLSNIKHKTIEQNIVVRDTKNFNTENFLIKLIENLNVFHDNYIADEQLKSVVLNVPKSHNVVLRK